MSELTERRGFETAHEFPRGETVMSMTKCGDDVVIISTTQGRYRLIDGGVIPVDEFDYP